jgi:hypothetical protein
METTMTDNNENKLDVRYDFEEVPTNPGSLCARLSFAYPILYSRFGARYGPITTKAGLQILLMYREMLRKLAATDSPCLTRDKLRLMRNCPPTGFFTKKVEDTPFVCNRTAICPWCHGRAARDVFERIKPNFVKGFETVRVSGVYHEQWIDSTDIKALICRYKQKLSKLLKFNLFSCRGAYTSVSVEPVVFDGERQLKVSLNLLAILREGKVLRRIPDNWVFRSVDSITPFRLAGVVGKVLRYPVGMMYGVTQDIAAVLRARGGIVLNQPYECLRNTGVATGWVALDKPS